MDAIPTIRFICLVFFAVRIYSYPYPVSRLFATLFFLFQLEGIEININILRRAPSRRVTALARARKFRRFLATCTATCPRSPSGTAFYPLYVPSIITLLLCSSTPSAVLYGMVRSFFPVSPITTFIVLQVSELASVDRSKMCPSSFIQNGTGVSPSI
jgi:hypothetical protein